MEEHQSSGEDANHGVACLGTQESCSLVDDSQNESRGTRYRGDIGRTNTVQYSLCIETVRQTNTDGANPNAQWSASCTVGKSRRAAKLFCCLQSKITSLPS